MLKSYHVQDLQGYLDSAEIGTTHLHLPNWMYSSSLATYLQEQEIGLSRAHSWETSVEAVQLYPGTVVALMEK